MKQVIINQFLIYNIETGMWEVSFTNSINSTFRFYEEAKEKVNNFLKRELFIEEFYIGNHKLPMAIHPKNFK